MYDMCIKNGVVYKDNQLEPLHVYIRDGIISALSLDEYPSKKNIDIEGKLVFPGLIDPHVHFDLDLGFIRSKDDFESGTRAAAYGGVTTIIDFLDPVQKASDLEPALKRRLEEAKSSHINYLFHATVKNPKNQVVEILQEMQRLNLTSVKLFTTYSESNRRTFDQEIKDLLIGAKKANIRVLAHIERDEMIHLNDAFHISDLPKSRPSESETLEALKLAKLVKETDSELYMVHCSSGKTVKALKESFPDLINSRFLIESCPHYFMFDQSKLQTEKGYLYTMAPPLRSLEEQELLFEHFDSIDTIGTDHCAFNDLDKKDKLLVECPLGVAGVEQSFDIMYALFGLKAVSKMSENVAKSYHLFPKKGVIKVGSDADLMIYEPGPFKIGEGHGQTHASLYEGYDVKGRVHDTIVGGTFVIKNRQFVQSKGHYLGGSSWKR